MVYAKVDGGYSFVYVRANGNERRLTKGMKVWESGPVLSNDNSLVAFASASSETEHSAIWISRVDGSEEHRISPENQDAIMPAFGVDTNTLFYVISRSFGHHSPIAASRRHDFDIVKTIIASTQQVPGAVPVELTQQYFYDVQSLSVAADGKHFIVSTTGYPIGSLIEEFDVEHPLRQHKIFQPHVFQEPRSGPSFGQAAYLNDGMDVVFTAATEGKDGGNFDYNVYEMSDVTGSEIKILTHHTGIIDSLVVSHAGTIGFVSDRKFTAVPSAKPGYTN